MNDRYLYRAKRTDNGEWITWNILTGIPHSVSILEDTVCACTGLKDKNGKLIWENDIVKKHFYTDYDNYANSEEYIGFVKYEDCAWVIETKRDNRICTRPIIESIAYSDDIKYFEVIGNRFDNPEMLEVGE